MSSSGPKRAKKPPVEIEVAVSVLRKAEERYGTRSLAHSIGLKSHSVLSRFLNGGTSSPKNRAMLLRYAEKLQQDPDHFGPIVGDRVVFDTSLAPTPWQIGFTLRQQRISLLELSTFLTQLRETEKLIGDKNVREIIAALVGILHARASAAHQMNHQAIQWIDEHYSKALPDEVQQSFQALDQMAAILSSPTSEAEKAIAMADAATGVIAKRLKLSELAPEDAAPIEAGLETIRQAVRQAGARIPEVQELAPERTAMG